MTTQPSERIDDLVLQLTEEIDKFAEIFTRGDNRALRARAAVELGDLCWTRYWLVRHDQGHDIEQAVVSVDRLIALISPLLTQAPDLADLTDARLVAGLAFLERYELTGDPANLDRGADLLAVASIFDLPGDDPRRCQAGSELVDALRQLSILDNSRDALDRAVLAAGRTLELADPSDGTAWFLLHRYTASAARNRWLACGDRADLELAYQCWQVLLPLGMDGASAREYESVLADRSLNS